jgi:hypothetical protein
VKRPKRRTATTAARDLDARTDPLVERFAPLIRQLQAAQDQARRLGLFPNDRDLLSCPNCGLAEDVLVGRQFVTNVGPGQPDTGLRFIEPTADDSAFLCPAYDAEARAQEA